MLFEIFSNDVYDMTPCDEEIKSKKVPKTIIREKDNDIRNKYEIARNIVLYALDREFNTLHNAYYGLCMKHEKRLYSVQPERYSNEFEYKIDIYGVPDEWETIEGTVLLNSKGNMIGFSRRSREEDNIDDCCSENPEYDYSNEECDNHPVSLELSPDSFNVEDNDTSIEISCPEMEIGKIEKETLTIDQKRQHAQDMFIRKISRKISDCE